MTFGLVNHHIYVIPCSLPNSRRNGVRKEGESRSNCSNRSNHEQRSFNRDSF